MTVPDSLRAASRAALDDLSIEDLDEALVEMCQEWGWKLNKIA